MPRVVPKEMKKYMPPLDPTKAPQSYADVPWPKIEKVWNGRHSWLFGMKIYDYVLTHEIRRIEL